MVVHQVNYVRMERVLQDVAPVLIVAMIDHVSMDSVLILVNAMNLVVRMLYVK